ncbi:hypothetical protein [Streptomyces sp. NPDC048590]|uniref:hypothetical protein n=1 Tax=Streptomyces sp. NPDC048590 TaxID=3365574 RepID=UPI00371A9B74
MRERDAAVGEIVERGLRAARWVAETRGYERVYAGGAPLAGLGSPKSDVDLYVVTDGKQRQDAEQVEFEGERVDIEFIALPSLRGAVDLCTTFRASPDNMRQIGYASRSRMDFLTRFLLGDIVVDDGVLQDLRDHLQEDRTEFLRLLVARHCVDVQNIGEDVEGALLNKDLPGADYQARELLYRAADAYLCHRDDPYVNTKWLWAKWERTVGDGLGTATREVIRSPHLEDTEGAVRRDVWLAQDLVAMAATGYRYEPLPDSDPWHCRRTTEYALVPTRDEYLVMRRANEAVSLSRQGVLLWGLAHGRSREDACKAVRAVLAEQDGADVSLEEIDGYYGGLEDHGLIRRSGTNEGAAR